MRPDRAAGHEVDREPSLQDPVRGRDRRRARAGDEQVHAPSPRRARRAVPGTARLGAARDRRDLTGAHGCEAAVSPPVRRVGCPDREVLRTRHPACLGRRGRSRPATGARRLVRRLGGGVDVLRVHGYLGEDASARVRHATRRDVSRWRLARRARRLRRGARLGSHRAAAADPDRVGRPNGDAHRVRARGSAHARRSRARCRRTGVRRDRGSRRPGDGRRSRCAREARGRLRLDSRRLEPGRDLRAAARRSVAPLAQLGRVLPRRRNSLVDRGGGRVALPPPPRPVRAGRARDPGLVRGHRARPGLPALPRLRASSRP